MAAMSDYLEPKILDEIFNGVAFAAPAGTWVALYTVAPSDAGGGTEVTGGAYARVQVNVNGGASPAWTLAADNGGGGYKVENGADVTFPQATADWGTVVAVGIFDASTAGNLLFHGSLTTSKTVTNGDTFKFPANNLVINLA